MTNKNKLIWDIPTRLFHWLLVIGFFLQWLTGEYLDDAIDWHFTIGYCMLGLILFRLTWGVIGTRYARFKSFIFPPKEILQYAKSLPNKNSETYAGHNPIGGIAVLVMLLMIGLQALSGLFVSDDIFSEGPYRSVANQSVTEIMEFIHFNFFDFILAIVALHILAVLFYQFYKKQTLINAMIHGKKQLDANPIPSSKLWAGLLVAGLIAIAVYILVAVLPPQPEVYY